MPRTIIVTGGSRGIGFGIAACFARLGDRLVIADVDLAAAEKAAAELDRLGATGSFGLRCDVSKRADAEYLVAETVARAGHIDVLVNNAGICPFQEVMEMSEETWRRTMDINCNGAFLCTQAAARHMISRGGGGRVVFITSLAENVTGPQQVDYGASKAGMRMTMVGFATALGKHGITCNAVAPGMILTDMTRHHWEKPEPAAFIKTRVPVGRIGTPDDIGNAAVFLASDGAAYVSGVTLRVDGGHQAVCS